MKQQLAPVPEPTSSAARVGEVGGHHELEAERAEGWHGRPARALRSARPFQVTSPHGDALDERTRLSMQRRLGHDFSKVRVFASSDADASARALDAGAYSVGHDIVFGHAQYSPRTRSGQALLAHELTHVAQQREHAAPRVMRKGRTGIGFLANLFQFWDYSKETLDEYLATLDATGEIVGDHDSDDMARQIAAEWKADASAFALTPRLRVLLIREMLDGAVLGSDQEGIITLLEGSTNLELKTMIGAGTDRITVAEMRSEFGVLKKRFELFEREVLDKLEGIKPPPEEGSSLLETLEEKEKEVGVRVDHVALSFRLAAGTLVEGFWANVAVPERGSNVTITVTRTSLRIDIDPGIVIDLIGPVNPSLRGVRFAFKGNKAAVDLDMFSESATEVAADFIRDLLAGTRFASPDYDFSRDPHLISEIKDRTILGDIDRVRYNLQKTADPEEEAKEKDGQEKALDMISGARVSVKLVHPKGERIPKEADGWGLRIPEKTTFTLTIHTEGKASELAKKDVRLARVGVHSSGVFIARAAEDIVELSGFDILPGLQFDLAGFRAVKNLKQVFQEEFPGEFSASVSQALSDYDMFADLLGGGERKSDAASDLAEWIIERTMSFVAPHMVRIFWSTIRDFSGMSDAQLSKFFGLEAPAKQ